METHTVHVSSTSSRLLSTAMTSCLMLPRFQTHHHSSNNSNIPFYDSVSSLNTYKSSAIFPSSIIAICRFQKKHHRSPLLSFSLGATSIVSSSLSEMDASSAQNVYPLHRCKTIHLVRHAQGIHNVAGEKDHSAYLSPDLFDAELTPLGWQQVDNLRKHVHATGLSKRVELVISSPLLRTMQTAVGVFGGEGYTDAVDVLPLMVANSGNSNRPAISTLACPPFIAVETCREHLGVHWCDKRRSISEYKPLFPAIDFSLIENDADILWKPDVREANEELAARGMDFLNWLWTRKEKEIAVVTHSGFLIHTLSEYGNDCHPSVKSEICRPFNNCELRSIVIVDKRMMGSDSPTTDYPGKIPSGPDVPSDL